MKTEKIVQIAKVRMHRYDESQRETAIYAKSDKRAGYRWYVGYGGDYIPAAKADLNNFADFTGGNEIELTDVRNFWIGRYVQMYRKG